MLKSMTGFGTGNAAATGEDLTVEVKSVNHKFCEVKVRVPRELAALEATLAKRVKDRLARGAVEVLVKRQQTEMVAAPPAVDMALAKEYQRAMSEAAAALGVAAELHIRDLTSLPGVLRVQERTVDVDAASAAATQALGTALAALEAMRKVEGKALESDLRQRLATLEATAQEIRELAPASVDEYRQRLSARLEEIASGVEVEPQRLAQEVAFFAERVDVAEEMTRLVSHFGQFKDLLASSEPVGRKMDFLVQEMNREINTTGSKAQSLEITRRVVEMKAELERIREQVQNVE